MVDRDNLKRRQRMLSRAKKSSNNREKKRWLLAKAWSELRSESGARYMR